MATLEEMIEEIKMDAKIKAEGWRGKFLALGIILDSMDADEASGFMEDMFMDMGLEISDFHEASKVLHNNVKAA